MKAFYLRLLCPLLCLMLVFVGCPPADDRLDDDDSGDDDDSAAGDDDTTSDDDDAVSLCDAPASPYTFELVITDSAGVNSTESLDFDGLACTDYNGDEWSISYSNSSGWQLRVVAGPLVEGETLDGDVTSSKIDITLQNNSLQAVYSGRLSMGHSSSIEVQRYQSPAGPCGWLSTEPLQAPSADGGSVAVGPQPIPFNCPN